MTDLDQIRDELALEEPAAREALAQELHRLRKLESVVRARRRSLPALVTHWLNTQPPAQDLGPPPEGTPGLFSQRKAA